MTMLNAKQGWGGAHGLGAVVLLGVLAMGAAPLAWGLDLPDEGAVGPLVQYARRLAFVEMPEAARYQQRIIAGHSAMASLMPNEGSENDPEVRARLADWATTMAILHIRTGQHRAALFFARGAAEVAPDNFEAHSVLGEVLENLGRPSEAREAYERALTIDPDATSLPHFYGFFLLTQNDIPAAAEQFEHAIRRSDDRELQTFAALGRTLIHQVERTPVPDYVDELRLDVKAWPTPVLLYLNEERTEEELVRFIAESEPNERRLHLNEALFYAGMQKVLRGEEEAALPYFRESIKLLVPAYRETHWSRAMLRRLDPATFADEPEPDDEG